MGFDRGFTIGLIVRLAVLLAASTVFALAMVTPGLAAARLVAGLAAGAAGYALWWHVARTNREVARFVGTLRNGDLAAHFGEVEGTGFGVLGAAFDGAIQQLRADRSAAGDELGYLGALVDDMPVALLTIDEAGRIDPGNKAARRLFARHDGVRAEDYAVYGATFAMLLATQDAASADRMLMLNLAGRAQRAIVRTATLIRLGRRARVVIVAPVQEQLDAVEMAAQADIVRVLTHEILNSLTPVTSLAATAAALLESADAGSDPRIADAQSAVGTLARRAEGLRHFIDSYRAVARPPEVKRRHFAAMPFATELERLFRIDWPAVALTVTVDPPDLSIDADPDLLAQVLINLLRNAAEATVAHTTSPEVGLLFAQASATGVRIDVCDNGPGVPAAMRGDIFLPFFTTRAAGTGVGLNLSRQIVVAHGGALEIVDRDDGALFRISL